MSGCHRVGSKSLILGAVIVILVTIAPAIQAPVAKAHSQATSLAPIEQSKEVLAETSIDGPALWTSNASAPNLGLASVLAWTGSDSGHSLNILESSDGVTYGGKVTFPESSATRPAIAVQGPPTTIVLGWTGEDPHHSLNLLCQGLACGTSGSGYKKVTLTDNSFTSPALTRFGSGFLLVWAGTDTNHSLNVLPFRLSAAGSGFQFGTKTILSQFGSLSEPSIALNSQNGQLLLSWSATAPVGELMFATSTDGVGWSSAPTLSEVSTVGPAGFAVSATSMPPYWVAWTGEDTGHSLNVRFTTSLSQWPLSDKTTFLEAALGGPGLGFAGNTGVMVLAWTGMDTAHHLNIATVTTSATPTLDQRIDAYVAGLTTNQLIGLTLMVAVCTDSYAQDATALDQALQQFQVGSAIIFTSCNGTGPHPPTASGLQQLDAALQSHASPSGSLLIGTDEEGGTVDRLSPYYGSTPSAQQLGASGNPQNAYNQEQTDAGRLHTNGLNVDFAPVVDVNQGGGEGPSRMFGSTVGTVTTYAGAFLDGLQQNNVAGTLKHWPGIGAATGNPDFVLPTINKTQVQMNAVDFATFRNLLYQAPGMIMATTVSVPAFDTHAPADLSPILLKGVLRGQLGYQGVIITDSLGANSVLIYMRTLGFTDPTQAIAEASVRAIQAGADILLAPLSETQLAAMRSALMTALSNGRITLAELQDAAHRIIRLKVQLGLISL